MRDGIVGLQQIDAGAEGDDLDRDLVGIVEFHEVVGDADDEAGLFRIVLRELQHDLVLGERLVLQRDLLRADGHGRQRHSATAEAPRYDATRFIPGP